MSSSLFGAGGPVNDPPKPATALRIQSSMEGRPISLVWGETRVSGNLIWYGDFSSRAINDPAAGGGKGGATGGGGKGAQGGVSYVYFASVAIAICEGPIAEILRVWGNKSVGIPGTYDFITFLGTSVQTAWGYLLAAHPTQALNYRSLVYVASNLSLGQSSELPNFSFEVRSTFSNTIAGKPDADIKDVIVDFLTNARYGVGWPTARLDTAMTQLSNYCRANGLVVSPALVDQQEARSTMADWATGGNFSFRWSGGLLTAVPWGDASITANGVTFVANTTPVYDLTDDDLLANHGSGGAGGVGDNGEPVICMRLPEEELINAIQVEFANRANNYDPSTIDAKDQAAIDAYGIQTEKRDMHFFADAAAANLSATLQLQRERVAVSYVFTLPPKFILPDVEDLLTITRSAMGLNRQALRIKSIEEQDDGSFVYTCEEWLGTASAPLYGKEAQAGATANLNEDPGDVNTPLFFEPTDQLAGGLQVWGAITGENPATWGGANVYASYDNVTFQFVTRVLGPARVGSLTASLPAVTENLTGQTIDEINTLSVDLTTSQGSLVSGSETDALGLNTACYVGGEIVAYKDATLTSAFHYDLTFLVRGAFGTESLIDTWPIGTAFARLDQGIAKVPYDQVRIGETVFIKFQSFNIYGGGLQDLSTVPEFTYVIQGTALASPLPDVENVRLAFLDARTKIEWDEISDFRTVAYEVRVGPAWETGLSLGTLAHPPISIPGDGTYWIKAIAEPVAGLHVESENATSITVTGTLITTNIVATWDEAATGWTGTFSGGAGLDTSINAIRTGSAGDILSEPDMLAVPDVLNLGGQTDGMYTIPTGHIINIGYVAEAAVSVTFSGQGVPVGQDLLTEPDILSMPDILGSESTRFVNVFIEIAVSQDGVIWAPWQKFSPGVYLGRAFNFRVDLETDDPNTVAYCTQFAFTVDVPDRIDYLTNIAVPNTGLAVVFQPRGAATPAPFNGGPDAGLPHWTGSSPTAGDVVYVTGLTNSGCTVFVSNGGVNVTRSGVNINFVGW